MNYQQDPILKRVIDDLIGRYLDNIIAIYGIGSYFDKAIPSEWLRNDIDIIVIVKSLEKIPKPDWTDVHYKKKQINGKNVWIGFNTVNSYRDRYSFNKESFSNYEWSLIELKHPENSLFLYGNDIRNQISETINLQFDYDDILARGLYHIDKSMNEKDLIVAKRDLSKGIFKIAFYFCIFYDQFFRKTSIIEIGNKLKELKKINEDLEGIINFYEEAFIFRLKGQYKSAFINLREAIILYVFSLLERGSLHREMNYQNLVKYLSTTFNGLSYLLQKLHNSNLYMDDRVNIENVNFNMRNITIPGRIKQIFGTHTFNKEEGTEGRVGSFLLSDPTGEIRVVLWGEHTKVFKSNEFNLGRSLYVVNGYAKEGRKGEIEIHASTYGNIFLLPEDQNEMKEKQITKAEIAKRLEFIEDRKSIRIPCPFCGFLCPPDIKKCRKCGEVLPK